MMLALYNEIDRFCCDWLSNLMDAGHITPGKIDDRSITELTGADVAGYERVHFFAGIAGWDLALNLAGWRGPVWTGSCPCQPFSVAGQQRGSEDERHLWPAFFRLISECRPPVVVGEQVAGAAGLAWLDHVCADLEGAGYAVAAADLPACSVGAPHRRQRLWWVAHADSQRRTGQHSLLRAEEAGRDESEVSETSWSGDACSMANTDKDRCKFGMPYGKKTKPTERRPVERSGIVGDTNHAGLEGRRDHPGEHASQQPAGQASPWSDLAWLPCSDGKARPTQPGIFPLAHGFPNRVGILRGAGNAIVPALAAEFVAAVMDCRP